MRAGLGRAAAAMIGRSTQRWCPALRHSSTPGSGCGSSRQLSRARPGPRLLLLLARRPLRFSQTPFATFAATISTLPAATVSVTYPSPSPSSPSSSTTPTTISAARARPQPPSHPHQPRSAQIRTMSDDAYAAFLGKASKDYSGGRRGSVSGMKSAEIGELHEPHPAIESLGEVFYTSDADEPFVSVQLEGKGSGLPDAATFAEIVGAPSEDVSIQSVTDWDPRNEYKAVVEAVVKASGVDGAGELKVYRVQEAGSRALYYILGAAKDDRKLKGVRVKAVES